MGIQLSINPVPFRDKEQGGKCRRGNVFCRAAGERRPVGKRDEGPGETEGVSPGAILRPVETKRPRTNPGPEWMGLGCSLSCRLFLCCSFRGCCLGLVRTLGLGFDGLGLLWCEHLLGLGEQVWLGFMGNPDVVG